MAAIHKSKKSLKRDGILLLLFDVVVLSAVITRNMGIVFTSVTLNSVMIDLVISVVINIWWVADSKNWIKNTKQKQFIRFYIILEVMILAGIFIFSMINQTMIAIVLIYFLLTYFVIGIVLIMHYI